MSSYFPAIEMPVSASGARNRVGAWTAIFLPSLGAAIFCVTLLHVLFVSSGTRTLFRDSDAGWHIRVGEKILRTSIVPSSEPFSYTSPGRTWFAWEWVSDALLGWAHSAAGPAGVAFLAAFAIALAIWGSTRLALRLGGNFFFTAIAAGLMMGATSIHWLARPHIFSWLLALIFLAVAEEERNASSKTLYWLPAIACLWANMHASFPLGPGILAVYAVGEWLRGGYGRISCRRFALAAANCFAATLINPFGWRLHAHVTSYLRDTYLMDHISEFRSFNFHAPGAVYVELMIVAVALGAVALFKQRLFAPALLAVVLLHMATYSARHLPMAAVLLLPLSVVALTREAENIASLRSFLTYGARLQAIDRRVLGAVPVLLVVAATGLALVPMSKANQVGFDPVRFPVEAANFLESRGLERRVFAKDQWGGYLIYRFDGKLKVFVDGRSDMYGKDMLETYAKVVEVKPGWDMVLKNYAVDSVLVAPEDALASVLAISSEWSRVYSDSTATIFERMR